MGVGVELIGTQKEIEKGETSLLGQKRREIECQKEKEREA